MAESLEQYIERKVEEWSRALDLKATLRGSEWTMLCPFHKDSKPSFGVNSESGAWNCFGCEHGGKEFSSLVWQMSQEFGFVNDSYSFRKGEGYIKMSPFKLGNEIAKPPKQLGYMDDIGRSQFLNRGFARNEVDHLNSLFKFRQSCDAEGTPFIHFNIIDFDRKWQGSVRRSLMGDKRYIFNHGFDSEKYLYGESLLVDMLKFSNFLPGSIEPTPTRVVLVEGVFDYFKVLLAGYAPLAILSFAGPAQKLARIKSRFNGTMVFFFDGDVSASDKGAPWLNYAKMWGMPHQFVQIPDDIDDPGVMTLGQIRGFLQ